jgi:hypothetical protein
VGSIAGTSAAGGAASFASAGSGCWPWQAVSIMATAPAATALFPMGFKDLRFTEAEQNGQAVSDSRM